jgi:DNA modification methylase
MYRKKESKKEISVGAGSWGEDLHDMDAHLAAVPQSNFNDADMKQHPAQKPVSAMRWLINATTRPNDLVCDPFCGSGTTGIASMQLGRRFHGIEIDEQFRVLSERRIAEYGRI